MSEESINLNVPFEVYDRDVEDFGGCPGSPLRFYYFGEDDTEDIEAGISELQEEIGKTTGAERKQLERRLALGEKILAEVNEHGRCEFITYL